MSESLWVRSHVERLLQDEWDVCRVTTDGDGDHPFRNGTAADWVAVLDSEPVMVRVFAHAAAHRGDVRRGNAVSSGGQPGRGSRMTAAQRQRPASGGRRVARRARRGSRRRQVSRASRVCSTHDLTLGRDARRATSTSIGATARYRARAV